ncbi:MAG: HAD-IIIA family hydrolase [Exilispira sp.]
MQKLKAIIFDKDDTLMEDQIYSAKFEEEYFFNDVIPSCILLKNSGYRLFILSNQSGISKGKFSEKSLLSNFIELNYRLKKNYNFIFDGFFYCPHLPEYNCMCRKPSTGLFVKLISYFQIDPLQSFYIGDRLTDLYFSINAGLMPVIIHRNNYLYKDQVIYKDIEEIEILEEQYKVLIFNSIIDFANLIKLEKSCI